MPVTMSGMASGIDTDAIIEKLLKVEAQPIRQLEEKKKSNRKRKDALGVLKKYLEDINNSARELYGFRASYDEKKAISSDPSILDANATKLAKKGFKKIEVLKLASTHKISTDSINGDEKLPAGKLKIEVNGESNIIKFKGGKIKFLKEKIDEIASDIISSSLIKTSGNEYVLTLESKIPGKKGEIKITGDKDFLKKIGLVSGEKGSKKDQIKFNFDKRYFTSYMGEKKIDKQNGSLSVGKDGNSVKIKGLLWQEYTLPISTIIKKETLLEFNFSYNIKEISEEKIPFRVELGPEEQVIIKGIKLRGYNVSRIRKEDEKEKKKEYDSILGIGVVSVQDGKRKEKIYPIDKDSNAKQEIPIGKDFADKSISKIILYCNDGITKFFDAKILTPIKGKGLLEPKNIVTKPENAKLKIDGIEVERDRNDGLNDIIEGVTINLKRSSEKSVEINIEPDVEKSIEKIEKFVEAYNNYLDFNKKLIKTEKSSKPGDYKNNKYKQGLFVGDMSIVRLEALLKRTINGAYPNRADKPIKILPQLGISTGKINADWETIKMGKLIIEESLLEKTIRENPEGIKMFFGSDSDGDNKEDNGMAYSVIIKLKPYIQTGRSIISAKINYEDESIKLANEKIERHQAHLKKYEEKLRKKFATMEKSISGANSQRNWMNQQMGGSQKGK